MTAGIVCIWAGLRGFQNAFTKGGYSEWLSYLVQPAPVQHLFQLVHPHAIQIAKYFEYHLSFHLHDPIYTTNQSGNGLKAHFIDEQDKTLK